MERLLKHGLTPIDWPIAATLSTHRRCRSTRPPRASSWQRRAKRTDAIGYHARVQLAKLDRGEKLQTEVAVPDRRPGRFGDKLAMVFLAGEVVVDYSLRLKHEFDRSRLWINATRTTCRATSRPSAS